MRIPVLPGPASWPHPTFASLTREKYQVDDVRFLEDLPSFLREAGPRRLHVLKVRRATALL